MKTRGEDIRPLNQPQVQFTYVLMNLRSCAEPCKLRGLRRQALSAFLRGHSQQNHMGYRWQVTPWHWQATPQCLIMWYSGKPGAGLFVRSRSHVVICREACWTLSCCSGVNWRLFELGFLGVIDSRVFKDKECNVKLSWVFLINSAFVFCVFSSSSVIIISVILHRFWWAVGLLLVVLISLVYIYLSGEKEKHSSHTRWRYVLYTL